MRNLSQLRGRALLAPLAGLLFAACSLPNPGVEAPPNTLNFPIAIGLIGEDAAGAPGAPGWLVVGNSNFDLRYSAGTLQAFNLARMHAMIGESCAVQPQDGAPCEVYDRSVSSSENDPVIGELIDSEVFLGTHLDGLAISSEGDRVYAAVRSNRNLSYIDFNAGQLDCGGEGERHICDAAHRRGDEEEANARGESVEGDPVDILAAPLRYIGGGEGDYLLMASRLGEVSLFIDDTTTGSDGARSAPVLADTLDSFSRELVTLTLQPSTGLVWSANSSLSNRELQKIGVVRDPNAPERSLIYRAGSLEVVGLDDGSDARDMSFVRDEDSDRLYVLSRRPEAVLAFDLDREGFAPGEAALWRAFEVGAGPSRLEIAEVGGRTYAFVSCFDAQRLFVVDLDYGEVVAVLGGFSGPFEMVVDVPRSFLYVADFRTSVIHMVDLSPLGRREPAVLAATIGRPRPVQELE